MRAFVLQLWLSCRAGWGKDYVSLPPNRCCKTEGTTFNSRSLNLSLQISDILDTTYISGVACDVSPAFQITEHTKICFLHFKLSEFRVSLSVRRYLKDDAISSIFSWSAASPKRKSPRKRTPSHSIAHDQKPSCSSKNDRNLTYFLRQVLLQSFAYLYMSSRFFEL